LIFIAYVVDRQPIVAISDEPGQPAYVAES
jgi:hypothetical protein